jgi:hypothetical protein
MFLLALRRFKSALPRSRVSVRPTGKICHKLLTIANNCIENLQRLARLDFDMRDIPRSQSGAAMTIFGLAQAPLNRLDFESLGHQSPGSTQPS